MLPLRQEEEEAAEVSHSADRAGDRRQELEAAQAEDRAWREERREQVVSSLERVEGRYNGVTDFLTRLGAVMGVVFIMGVLTVVLLAMFGGAHLAQVGLLLMGVGLTAMVALSGIGGLCWLAWTGITNAYRKWARWQAIEVDLDPDEKG